MAKRRNPIGGHNFIMFVSKLYPKGISLCFNLTQQGKKKEGVKNFPKKHLIP